VSTFLGVGVLAIMCLDLQQAILLCWWCVSDSCLYYYLANEGMSIRDTRIMASLLLQYTPFL